MTIDGIKNWFKIHKKIFLSLFFLFGSIGVIYLCVWIDQQIFPHNPIVGLPYNPWSVHP